LFFLKEIVACKLKRLKYYKKRNNTNYLKQIENSPLNYSIVK